MQYYMAAEIPKKKTDLPPKDYLQQKLKEWQELVKVPGYENFHLKICVSDLELNKIILCKQIIGKTGTRY